MLNQISFRLEAHSVRLNHHRTYIVEIGQDLFGVHTVDVGFGRVGSWRRVQRFALATAQDASRLVAARLRRRATARSRIGCSYQLVDGQTKISSNVSYTLDLSAFQAVSSESPT